MILPKHLCAGALLALSLSSSVFGLTIVRTNDPSLAANLSAADVTAAIEAALAIEAMRQGIVLPTVNHLPDPALADLDVVPNLPRRHLRLQNPLQPPKKPPTLCCCTWTTNCAPLRN